MQDTGVGAEGRMKENVRKENQERKTRFKGWILIELFHFCSKQLQILFLS